VGSRAGLAVMEKRKMSCPLPGIEPRLLGHKTLTDAVDKYKKFCDILDIYFEMYQSSLNMNLE
jgi:hypothetical protein